jgi:hypothetical protein
MPHLGHSKSSKPVSRICWGQSFRDALAFVDPDLSFTNQPRTLCAQSLATFPKSLSPYYHSGSENSFVPG